MLGLSELRQTKVYQEALQEGERSLILRQLSRCIGELTPEAKSQIQALSLPQLDALLDFSVPADLVRWLEQHST